ncbi:MAG: DNA polymerase III subunit gamma/tau [Desulfobulbaceae bacterium]|nr:DNA polymerase III subunit gamma/tau [Desulfobulbaceae bacterium]
MSYRVLARKWRPQTFCDIVGQEPIVRTLQNALRRNRVAHALIFSGVRGVGKTTIARIMAKAINCHNPAEAPCDKCSSCLAIIKGNALDLHEIDGASNRGIQEIRDLKENIRFMPAQERFKVIIIDEVHMLTTEAFNALLKTLEEPPEHVFFMFATTEIHKVPVTILSRCQRYELKRVPFKALFDFFASIASREGVTITSPALDIIATEADGSVRDGLSLLDQIFAFGGDTVTEDDLRLVLGLVDRRVFATLASALLGGDLAGSLSLLNETYSQGMDLKRFAQGLLFFCRSLLIAKTSKEPSVILDISEQEMALVKEISGRHSIETLSNLFSLVLKGMEEMQYAAHPRMIIEMLFVKVVQAGAIVPVSTILTRLDALLDGHPAPIFPSSLPEGDMLAPASTIDRGVAGVGSVSKPVPGIIHVSASVVVPAEPAAKASDSSLSAVVTAEEETTDDEEVEDESHSLVDSTHVSCQAVRNVERDWDAFLGHVRERKKWMAVTLGQAEKVTEENGTLIVRYDESAECHMLQDAANRKLLTEFAQDFFQKELGVRIEVAGKTTGGELDQPQEDRRALSNDPRVQIAVEIFGGQVTGIRTGPRSR